MFREPNYHLFEKRYVAFEIDPGNNGIYNPLSEVNYILSEYNASTIKLEIKDWFDCAIEKDKLWHKGEPGDLILLHNSVVGLVEGGWLLTQCNEIPSDWIDPNTFIFFFSYKPDEGELFNHHLTTTEFENPHLALSSVFRRSGMEFMRDTLKDLLWYALQTKHKTDSEIKKLKEDLFRLAEALYLINLKVSSKMRQ